MNLRKKKILASKALNVGKERIVFLNPGLEDIKEAVTKQDIRDLHKEGVIKIKEIKGRKKVLKNKKKRRIRKKLRKRKQVYMASTRKFREHLKKSYERKEISKEELISLRKKVKNRVFKSKAHLVESLKSKKK